MAVWKPGLGGEQAETNTDADTAVF